MPNDSVPLLETLYDVTIDEWIKALKGEPFKQGKGLYRMTGEEIEKKQLLGKANSYFDENQEYILLLRSRLIGSATLRLENEELIDYGVGLVFYKSIIPDISLKQAKTFGWYFFYNQTGDIWIENNSQSGNIWVGSNSQSGDIGVLGKSQSGFIRIENNSQSGDIRVWNNSESEYIRIDDNSLSGEISILGKSQSGDITINKNSQSANISVYNNLKPFAITIDKNSQTGNIDLKNAYLSHVTIKDNYFGLSLYNTQFLMIQIVQCLLTNLEWSTGNRGELYITQQTKILFLRLSNVILGKDSLLSISDTQLKCIVLEELYIQGNFLLRKIISPIQYPFIWRNIEAYLGEESQSGWRQKLMLAKKKLLKEQKNQYDTKLVSLKKDYADKSVFRISHSSLGKTEITGSNLTGYRFEYLNSKLLDCFITGTELPKDKIDIYNPIPNTKINDKDWYEQKVSIYNQFKKIFENQGDVVEASWYHAKAMDNQQALLQLTYKEQTVPWYKKVASEKAFNLLGFWLNKISNNHSESWRVALRFVLLISAIMYSLYYISIHWQEPFGFAKTGRFFGDYFGFLDITHRIDFHVPKEQLTPWSKFFDFFGRILIGYGFFQFIAAFRRHGKKGS